MVTQTITPSLVPTSRFSTDGSGKIVNTKFKFKNGWSVSVSKNDGTASIGIYASPTTAEVAVLDQNDKFVPFKDGQEVKGHVDADTLLGIMKWAASQ